MFGYIEYHSIISQFQKTISKNIYARGYWEMLFYLILGERYRFFIYTYNSINTMRTKTYLCHINYRGFMHNNYK